MVYDVWNDNREWSRYWGLTVTMGTQIESNSDGELGNIAQIITYGTVSDYLDVGTFAATANGCNAFHDPADEYLCFTWDGTIDLGTPGGHGTFGAGIEAVSGPPPFGVIVLPFPLPEDTVGDYPWYMYHVK